MCSNRVAGTELIEPVETGAGTQLLRSFSRANFEAWPSWKRLECLLSSPGEEEEPTDDTVERDTRPEPLGGGAFGLAGPRGVGKTWHMQRAVEFAREHDGIGLWYPSPSEYDSLAFLASLCEALANEVKRNRRRGTTLGYAALGRPIEMLLVVYLFLIFAAATFLISRLTLHQTPAFSTAAALLLGFAGVAVSIGLRRLRLARSDYGRLLIYAEELQRTVRYALTRRESSEFGAEAGSNLVGRLKRSREVEMVERPLTLATIVGDFRELARLAATAAYPGPLIISVDELDKIVEHETVRQLLRDIKGVFGVPNVYFLVSVSHEAARALNLNGVVERNEFNSSFDTVIELPTLDAVSACKLLASRGFPGDDQVCSALGVLAGGISRDIVRLAELVLSEARLVAQPGASLDVLSAVRLAMRVEAGEMRRDIVASGPTKTHGAIAEEAKLGTFRALHEDNFNPRRFIDFASGASDGLWGPDWADDAWGKRFGESWRRLIVRLAVAARLPTANEREMEQLRQVVIVSSQSAAVAREMLGSIGIVA